MSISELMKQDTDSRESIVLDTSTNFFVEAGAGSGKTTMLVRRMVAMVEAGIDVSKICAITFTKAAAGEFYDRFQKMLAERSTAPSKENFERKPGELSNPTDVTRKRCLDALQNIDLCFMGTIDSFCNMVLSEHPAEAGVPSDAKVISDDDIENILIREYSNILKGEYGPELRQEGHVFDTLNGTDAIKAFVTGVTKIMDIRHTDIVLPECEKSLDDVINGEKALLLETLNVIGKSPDARPTKEDQSCKKAWDNIEEYVEELNGDWEDKLSNIRYSIRDVKPLRVTCEWWANNSGRPGIHEELIEAHETKAGKITYYCLSSKWFDELMDKINTYKSSRCIAFLCSATRIIADNCRKTGNLTFFDYLLYLRDMLKKDAEGDGKLIKHIYDRHSYFLIDEFQDTNPMQAEVFFYLTAKKPVMDWRKCIPKPGSLFIVGDPKQSIYRFRNADVASFLKVKGLFIGDVGRVLYLTRNFRSTYKLRERFNSTFSAMLPVETPEQSKFEPIPLEDKPTNDSAFSGVYYYDACVDSKAPAELQDANVVAKMIGQLVGNPQYLIPRKKGEDVVKEMLTYSDFMLITPYKPELSGFMKAFYEAGIPFYVEGQTLFADCPALVEIVKIFDAVANPGNKHYLFKALTGKVFGLHRSRIAKCCQMTSEIAKDADSPKQVRFNLSIYANNEVFSAENGFEDAETLRNALSELKDLAFEGSKMSPAALFYKIMNELPVFSKTGADNLEYVWFALELLRSAELDGGVTSLRDGAAFLNDLVNSDSNIERCISLKSENNRVHLANLHKVKGLEAPVVILAWPKKTDHEPERRTVYNEQEPKSWIFRISRPREKGNYNSTPFFVTNSFEDEKQKESINNIAENNRLLYVAATRAKNAVLVCRRLKADGSLEDGNPWKPFVDAAEDDFANLPAGTPEAPVARECAEIEKVYENPVKYREGKLTGEASKASFKIALPSKTKIKAKSAEEEHEEDLQHGTTTENAASTENGAPKEKTGNGRKDAAIIGTMVHRVMEVLVSSGNRAEAHALVNDTVAEFGYPCPEKSEEYKTMLRDVIKIMQNGGHPQTNGLPQDILHELLSADEAYCEVPFCYKEHGEAGDIIWNGVMDVIYRKDGLWHIVDYKTNAEGTDLDRKYKGQLDAYIKAFKATTGQDADAKTYHIDI